ncbi:MetQ/NlpA family ABC transporter substrate-binding protein [Brachyspira innocens]|uniref:Lipoprotein n=1 Tax=Brachyspira innocens TaxID=13264 RepID=A0ABT8YWJ1_9SPIR|nr:MetQ/NlpA family ABC transporter substrate-binding protein [Brachyspira innocens]MDO6993647.1 MetQ/NlpA family ABC transporter substrate-binding protein [Brachyspira innocens]MDO7019707.1 MetQ/NlpA family ABC transporter substrate-binding protein [Brachyspira innocens]
MKNIIIFLSMIFLASCSSGSKNENVVKVGYIGESDRVIWEEVMRQVSNDNIKIELVSFGDYLLPNQALNDGDIDMNNFQHYAFFNNEVETKGYKLTAIADTCLAAMNIYSDNITNINEVKENDKIAIPNDPSNGGRALKVLEAAGLIKLRDKNIANPVLNDISENKLNLDIIEVDAGSIYSLLPDVACAVINCNFALNFGLNPDKDSIYKDNPTNYADKNYINLIAVREEDKDNEIYKKIVNAYQSDEVKEIYSNDFKGAYIDVW